ncbi:MAG: radical SAM peptide maturase [Bacteroidales bacterium]|nr:radical SAM peptide maturase [Bacteroidales bacterium]
MPDFNLFTTKHNQYLFSFYKKHIIYMNPMVVRYIKLKDFNATNNRSITEENQDESDSLLFKTKEKADIYYKRKFEFLKENGFFNTISNEQIIGGRLKPSDINYELSNLRALVFEITERCNLQCKYCFYGDNYHTHDSRNNLDLSIANAKAVIEYLIPKWLSKVNSNLEKEIFIGFFGGEPLLNFPFIEELVSYIEELSKNTPLNFRFNMTTNGVLLNQHIEFIAKNNFALTISLDGDSFANSYRLFPNNKESFKVVFKNIHLVKRNYPSFFEQNVLFNAVLHDRNDFISIQEFIWREFKKSIAGTEVNPLLVGKKFNYDGHNYDLNKSEHKKCFLSSGESLSYNMFLRNYTNNHFSTIDDLFNYNTKGNFLPTGTCNPFSKRMFVTAKGKILPCEAIAHEYSLGNVQNGKVFLDYEKIVMMYNNHFEKLKGKCNNCYRVNLCKECLFLNIIKEDKTVKCSHLKNEDHIDLLRDYYSFFEAFTDVYSEIWRKTRYA